MKLTDDTIENVDVAPGVYWKDNLESKVMSEAQGRVPEPQYDHHDTIITVSTSKRGEHKFEKPFRKLDIDWQVIENKLRSWSNSKDSLRVTILLIYNESQQAPATKKAGRGATKKHIAALDKLVAQQSTTGVGAVWQDIYRLFHCNSKNVCTNFGFYCWIHEDRHYKLDDKFLEQLIDCAEQGVELKSHADVPERIREMIKTREKEDNGRRKRKAAASLSDRLGRCCGHCRHDDAPPDCRDRRHACDVNLIKLNLPMKIDEAPGSYSDWLAAQVVNAEWQASYRAAGKAAIEGGYDLQWFCDNKAPGIDMLKAAGIMPGIADRFVKKVTEWVDEVNKKSLLPI